MTDSEFDASAGGMMLLGAAGNSLIGLSYLYVDVGVLEESVHSLRRYYTLT